MLSGLETDEIFRIGLGILEDDEDSGIVDVVGDGVVAELGARKLRWFLHVRTTNNELTSQHSTLKHVLDSVRVRRRVSFLSRVVEVRREVDALTVHCRCIHADVL